MLVGWLVSWICKTDWTIRIFLQLSLMPKVDITRSGALLTPVAAVGDCSRCPRRWTRRWSSTWASCWTSSGPCTPQWTRFGTPLRRGSRPSRGTLKMRRLKDVSDKSTLGVTCLDKHLLACLICICLVDQQKKILDYLLKLLHSEKCQCQNLIKFNSLSMLSSRRY